MHPFAVEHHFHCRSNSNAHQFSNRYWGIILCNVLSNPHSYSRAEYQLVFNILHSLFALSQWLTETELRKISIQMDWSCVVYLVHRILVQFQSERHLHTSFVSYPEFPYLVVFSNKMFSMHMWLCDIPHWCETHFLVTTLSPSDLELLPLNRKLSFLFIDFFFGHLILFLESTFHTGQGPGA